MSNAKILLVDDEEEFSEVLAERLGTRGFEVDVAKDGLEAIRKVKAENYEAVILDFAMPGLNGIETLEILLDKEPDLQVILLTGQATLENGVEALKLGAQDVLQKPADINKIVNKIKEAEANKMLIITQKNEEKIKDIIESKGW
jgi:two-component system response regulator RegA